MDTSVLFRAASLAALLGLVGVVVIAAAGALPEGIQAQPSAVPVPVDEFVRATNQHTDAVLVVFAGDSLFILSYLLVFVGLYAVTSPRARLFAAVGLGAGVFTALLDATENAFFITYALAAKNGMPLTAPHVLLIHILANLKWMGAFAALYAFGLIFPRRTPLEWALAVLMLLFPLVGIIGLARPALIPVRGLFFLVGMPLFAWYFWQQALYPTSNTQADNPPSSVIPSETG